MMKHVLDPAPELRNLDPQLLPAAAISTMPASATPIALPTRTASPTASPVRSPTSGPVWATIEQDAACRAGPGTDYNVLGYLTSG